MTNPTSFGVSLTPWTRFWYRLILKMLCLSATLPFCEVVSLKIAWKQHILKDSSSTHIFAKNCHFMSCPSIQKIELVRNDASWCQNLLVLGSLWPPEHVYGIGEHSRALSGPLRALFLSYLGWKSLKIRDFEVLDFAPTPLCGQNAIHEHKNLNWLTMMSFDVKSCLC